jgi:tetratricopeptide (TPR) repeat protein
LNKTENQIHNLNILAWDCCKTDRKKFNELSQQIAKLLKTHPNEVEKIKLDAALAVSYSEQGDFDKSLALLNEIIPLTNNTEWYDLKPYLYSTRGNCLCNLGDLAMAQRDFKEQLRYAKIVGDLKKEAEALNNLGLIFSFSDKNKEALPYYDKSFKLSMKIENNHAAVQALNNQSLAYLELKEYSQAFESCNKALLLAKSGGLTTSLMTSLWDTAGTIYMKKNKYGPAQDFFRKALVLAEKEEILPSKALALFHLGELFYYQGETDAALTWLNDSLEYIEKAQLITELKFCHLHLSELYEETGQNDLAQFHANEKLRIESIIRTPDHP